MTKLVHHLTTALILIILLLGGAFILYTANPEHAPAFLALTKDAPKPEAEPAKPPEEQQPAEPPPEEERPPQAIAAGSLMPAETPAEEAGEPPPAQEIAQADPPAEKTAEAEATTPAPAETAPAGRPPATETAARTPEPESAPQPAEAKDPAPATAGRTADRYAQNQGVVQDGQHLPRLIVDLDGRALRDLERLGGGRLVVLARKGDARMPVFVRSAPGAPDELVETAEPRAIARLGQRALPVSADAFSPSRRERLKLRLQMRGLDWDGLWFYPSAELDRTLARAQLRALEIAGVDRDAIRQSGQAVSTEVRLDVCNRRLRPQVTAVRVAGEGKMLMAARGCGEG